VSPDIVSVAPLSYPTTGVTQHSVRLALAQEDAANIEREGGVAIHDDISPAMLITSGLKLESQQYVFTSVVL
jgi:hypothetical protein